MKPNQVAQILLNHFDPSGYDMPAHLTNASPETQLGYIVTTEYICPDNLRRYGNNMQRLCLEWLKGLPSCVNLPFTYHDIGNFIVTNGIPHIGRDPFDSDTQEPAFWSRFGKAVADCVKRYNDVTGAINHAS
jgi:hypothetical protein